MGLKTDNCILGCNDQIIQIMLALDFLATFLASYKPSLDANIGASFYSSLRGFVWIIKCLSIMLEINY